MFTYVIFAASIVLLVTNCFDSEFFLHRSIIVRSIDHPLDLPVLVSKSVLNLYLSYFSVADKIKDSFE